MTPFYHRVSTNFGDHMNSWLWPEIVPELLHDGDSTRLVGIGSLLSRNLDLVAGKKVIFGTGSGYSSLPTPTQAAGWKIYAVRGPLTAKFLGLDQSKSITDGAWLINRIPRYSAIPTTRRGTVFVPHWTTAAYGNWTEICQRCDIKYVDPLWDCDTVFSALANAELAIVESLHGAIIADFYRTPWIAVASQKRILKFKWLDWCYSLGIEYQPFKLPPSDYVDCLAQKIWPYNIDTSLQPIRVASDTFDVPSTPDPSSKPSVSYHLKVQGKAKLRYLRSFGLEGLDKVRDGLLFRSWNDSHMEKMRKYMDEVMQQRPCLSSDVMRAEKIDRLNDALEQMKTDYSHDGARL